MWFINHWAPSMLITIVARTAELATLQPSLLAWTPFKSHAVWGLVTRCCYSTAHLPHFSGISHSTCTFIYFSPTSTEISNGFWELPRISIGLKVKYRKPVALPLVSLLPPLISTATFGHGACNAEHISSHILFLLKCLLNTVYVPGIELGVNKERCTGVNTGVNKTDKVWTMTRLPLTAVLDKTLLGGKID